MTPIKLNKVNYLSTGAFHHYFNNETGERLKVSCSDEDYAILGEQNTSPTDVEGYTWKYSVGGVIKTDSQDGELEEGEYCLIDNKIFTVIRDENQKIKAGFFTEEELNNYGYSI